MHRLIFAVAAFAFVVASGARGAEPLRARTEAHRVAELEFVTLLKRADPFNEVVLDVIFAEPGGTVRRVPAFWAGGRLWKVRYSSPNVGAHRFRTECNDDR